MRDVDYQYPFAGALLEDDHGICNFTVWAPEQQKVGVLLKGELHELTADAMGYWSKTIKGVMPGDPYKYRLDDGVDYPDPASRWQPAGVHGPSAVASRKFDWTDRGWKGLSLGEMIIYELHIGTFTNNGTFEGVISKLDYLRELGINAIELMPVVQFPGARNWGYDGVFPFAVHHDYGGMDGLKRLVNEAHAREIAVILDVVYNHQGPEGNYLSAYGPYFTDKYQTVWGQAINFDSSYCDPVRNFYWQNALMWLDEFHIDGLRLDAVHAIWDFSAKHFIRELKSKVEQLEHHTGQRKVLIAEIDLNNPRYIDPSSRGGYGLDGQWIDEFHHALHALVTGETNGYYEDFGQTEHLALALKNSYVYTGQYSVHRKKAFGDLPETNPYSQFVVFAQNHDQVGNRMLGDRLTSQLTFEALKLTAAVYLLSPHVPMLFMGEEYGEKNCFQYFISHTDEDLVEMVREGRKKEFSYFDWQGEVPDPQAVVTFNQCKLSWNPDKEGSKLLEYYMYLIRFRKERSAMQGKERGSLNVLGVYEHLIAFERIHEKDYLLIILHFGDTQTEFPMAMPFAVRKIFDSSSARWNGPGDMNLSDDTPSTINPNAAVIYEKI